MQRSPRHAVAVSCGMSTSPSPAPLGAYRFDELLAAVAAKTPTPGGGAVAGATGALACATAGMVVSYSVNKKDLAQFKERLEGVAKELDTWRAEFLALADADAEAYGKLNSLQKAAATGNADAGELSTAIEGALGVPVRCLRLSVEVVRQCLELAPITNKYLRSDLAIAGLLADTAARAAMWNVRVNLPLVEDTARRAQVGRECDGLVARAGELAAKLSTACS